MAASELPERPGVLPFQRLVEAVRRRWISSPEYTLQTDSIQPASIDLRLGDKAWPLQCSFLPDPNSLVEEKLADIAFDEPIDLLRGGAILEKNRPYLIPLREELCLPDWLKAKANPKSSTGRLDVFTRLITDRTQRFDEINAGYSGNLYLEVVPRSFAIKVQTGLALNQLRLIYGDGRCNDNDIWNLHSESPLLYIDDRPVEKLDISDGVYLSVDITGDLGSTVGFRAKDTTLPIDLTGSRRYDWQHYWEPVQVGPKSSLILDPHFFYLLLSAEAVSIPPDYAAEMMAYDPPAGELRTHYAGFFDPGFGYDEGAKLRGSRAALEVRARDVPFMIEHRQPIAKLAFEHLTERPAFLYGGDIGSNYQGQTITLSKHFVDQKAGEQQMRMRDLDWAEEILSDPR